MMTSMWQLLWDQGKPIARNSLSALLPLNICYGRSNGRGLLLFFIDQNFWFILLSLSFFFGQLSRRRSFWGTRNIRSFGIFRIFGIFGDFENFGELWGTLGDGCWSFARFEDVEVRSSFCGLSGADLTSWFELWTFGSTLPSI